MAENKKANPYNFTEEQLAYLESLPPEEREAATEELLGIKRFANGRVDLRTAPGTMGKFFRAKDYLQNPDIKRGDDGLIIKRYNDDHYFMSTCPFCGCRAEHEGKKFKYSKKTNRIILRDRIIMIGIVALSFLKILHVVVALAAMFFVVMDMTGHKERKMFYTVLCRNCQAHFPLEDDQLNPLLHDLKKKGEGIFAQENPDLTFFTTFEDYEAGLEAEEAEQA